MTDNQPNQMKSKRDRKVRQKKIGEELRKLYDEVTEEPVPDDFLKLLEEADKSEGRA